MTTGSDYWLGQQIAGLLKAQRASDLPSNAILSQVQDLLGSDTALLGPLRDLLLRPAYRQLQDQGAAGSPHSPLWAGREALLQDLALTYHPAVVVRLAAVIDGSLGLSPGPPPLAATAVPQTPAPIPGGAMAAWPAAAPRVHEVSPSLPSPPGAAASASPVPASAPAPAPVTVPAGPSAVTALLIALVSLLSGAVLLALGWLLVSSRFPTASSPVVQAPASPAPSPAPTPAPAPSPTPKGPSPSPPGEPDGLWGGAAEYKFGQLPGGAYPNSCAFSETDADGRITTDKSRVEYWACRDVGGDPERGYRVVWADGKETTYTFSAGGNGTVVGTNGSPYAMRWRNDSHQASDIIVIAHQDGAVSWIPGHIRSPQE